MAMDPGGLIAWIVVGLIAGFVASHLVRGAGFGMIGDIIVGIIGAFLGGFLASVLGFGGAMGFVGTTLVAVLGAVVLLFILHAVSPSARSRGI
jgi:uncharacterized membrane protein YeaQ/YmgE (transglycosylase-associated protein family)